VFTGPELPSMSVSFGPGMHATAGERVDRTAYDRYLGRWSRLFVPAVLAAAEVAAGHRVLDVATGPGEAVAVALSLAGASGLVVGGDISLPMLEAARARLVGQRFHAVAADAQALPFADGAFDAVVCQLGLMFFPDPARGLAEFRRVLRPGRRAAVCVIAEPERAPMWGVLALTLSGYLPQQRGVLHLSFALADSGHLEQLFSAAGFRDVAVAREARQGSYESFDDYWAPIELGVGSLPHAYRALPESARRAVREEVRRRLAPDEVGGRLVMTLEMLIGAGRA
jgi:ubiquinone/menaquinone biosynthesis C-methylase UbiE